jgi:hypothetical protein
VSEIFFRQFIPVFSEKAENMSFFAFVTGRITKPNCAVFFLRVGFILFENNKRICLMQIHLALRLCYHSCAD